MIHRLPLADVVQVHRPDARLATLRRMARGTDRGECAPGSRCPGRGRADRDRIGLGGSLLLGAQHPDSDIDLVLYGRDAFEDGRAALGAAIDGGRLGALDRNQWSRPGRVAAAT
jgi:predicted nucleotidyltransferase